MGIPDQLICFPRNLYAGQEPVLFLDWFTIGKGVHQSCILSLSFFNVPAEHNMWNARLDEALAAIKTAGRNISDLRYVDDTSLMAESEEELKSLLIKLKEESEKARLKLSI